MTAGIEGRARSRGGFVGNWVSGSGDSRSLRRRLMAALRLAHCVLGMGRKRLGLGTLGAGGTLASALYGSAPAVACAAASVLPEEPTCPNCGRVFVEFASKATRRRWMELGWRPAAAAALGALALSVSSAAPAQAQNYTAGGGTVAPGSTLGLAIGCGGNGATVTAGAVSGGMAIGCRSVSGGTNSIAIGVEATTTAQNGVAIGTSSGAGLNASAFGASAQATGATSSAFGFGATASGQGSVANGFLANAGLQNAVAIGAQATASALNSIYLGARTFGTGASAQSAIAIGTDVIASQVDAIAIGRQSQSTGTSATAMGLNARAWGNQSIALGLGAVAGVQANTAIPNSIAIGTNSLASGGFGVALGQATQATADFSTAVGNGAAASADSATALGRATSATGLAATAVGNAARATGNTALALGGQAVAVGDSTVAVGQGAGAGSTTANSGSVAMGIAAGTLVSGAQNTAVGGGIANAMRGAGSGVTGARNVSMGTGDGSVTYDGTLAASAGNLVTGDDNIAIGTNAGIGVSANNTTSIGVNANATAENAIAMGHTAVADAADAVAIGTGATATGGKAVAIGAGNVAYGDGAVAIGDPSYASGTGAFTGGANNIANADGTATATAANAANGAVAIGNNNVAIGQGSVALGNFSRAGAAGAVAFGDTAVANFADDVALGSGSVTAAAVATPNVVIDGATYNFAGTTPVSTVSVGALGAERTITNVAAGRLSDSSTDAVNGSQLFATNQAVDSLGTTVDNINNGGGIKYFHANSVLPDSQALGTDSVAIGPNAVANNADDVAIGSGAVSGATTVVSNAVIGGTTYNFAGATPAGAFSVGALGAERQIQNVAAGRLSNSSTDAVNGSQLFATNQQVTQNTTDIANLDGRVTTVEGDVTNLDGRVTTAEGNITNLGNTVNNIAGDTSTAYTDANGDGIRYVRTNDRTLPVADSSAQGIASTAVGYQATAVADNSLALGRDSQASIVGGVALGSGSIADRALAPVTGQIPAGATNFIEYNTTDKTLLGAVSVGTDTSYRQITNVADGTNAQDAVTIRQLQGAIASVATTPSMYFHANSTAGDSLAVGAESIAVGPTTVVNADNGVGIGNGAIVDQIAPGGTAIGQGAHVMLADGIALGTNSLAAGIQSVAIGAGAESNHANSIALGGNSITTVGAQTDYTAFGLAALQDSVGEVSIGAAGSERKLTNVAAGSADTDGVNVSQLRGMTQNVTNLFGGTTVVNPDGSITGPTYNIQGGSYTTVYDGFTAVDASLTNLSNQINGGGGIKYFHANSTLADSQATGVDSVAIGPESVASGDGSLAAGNGANAGAQGAVALGQGAEANNANDVALGSGSVTEAAVGTSSAVINGQSYDFAGTAPVGTVSVGADGAERTITNVAAGRVSADSTDAINGSQLHATNTAIEDLETDVGSITQNAVQYDLNPDGSKKNSITLQGGDVNAPVIISNVGAGVADTDAVNVSQLNEGITESRSYTDNRVSYAIDTANDYTDTVAATTLNQANSYTDQKFDQLNQEVGEIRDEARQAAAIGLAAASLRYDDRPGKLSVAMGGGYWRSEGALAFGAGYTSENGRVRANLSGTTTDGHWGVGAGLSFTLN